jgi:2-(1,2-epoxy-1,2-dihydrophenyl)acetyl-CoA isomerase
MSMSEIEFEIRDHVARITINRPDSMNAMTTGMWPDMADMLREVEPNPQVHCILIAGAGANFCAGGDVKEFSTTVDMKPAERAVYWNRVADRVNGLFHLIERVPQTVVVSARGVAAGGGLSLIAAADLAIVSENCRCVAAQIRLGAIPDSALGYNLVRSVGLKRAKQHCLLGETFDAGTALEMGLVNWVVPDPELESRTEALVAKAARIPAVAMARTKAELNFAHARTLADHLAQESQDVAACVVEDSYVDNVRAFMDKRRP